MSFGDWSSVVANVVTVLLLLQQNKIFKHQNEIFAAQSGASMVTTNTARLRQYWPMLAMAGLVVLMWTVTGYSYYQRHFGTPLMYTSVRIGFHEFTTAKGNAAPVFDLQVGKPVAMNLGIANYGPLPAFDTVYKFKIDWHTPMSKSVEDDAWSDFLRTTTSRGPQDLQVANQSWGTYYSGPLTADDIHDAAGGRRVLYIFSHYEYTDTGGRHSTDICEFLMMPLQPGPQPGTSALVYGNCEGHNRIR